MGGCSVIGCKSRSERKIDGISFHSFPNVPEMRTKWIKATGRQDWVPKRASKICSLHFDARCLVFTGKLGLLNVYAEPKPVEHNANQKSLKRPSSEPSTSQAALKKKHNKLSVHENNRSSCYPVRPSNPQNMAQGALTEKQDTNNSIIMDNNPMDECRACLQKIVQQTAYNILEPWFTPWAVRGSIIADDLAKLADVEITELDKYPKIICPKCYHSLSDACKFMIKVQRSDSILRERASLIDSLWPQPIMVNKTKNTDIDSSIQVEIKQEVLSEDENGPETEQDWEPTMDIKIEPEEIIGAKISSGSTSPFLDPLTTDVNGDDETQNETHNESSTKTEDSAMNIQEFLDNTIKEEPISGDDLSEAVLDLSLDCVLCLKVFNSISGLKAHVISQHSYKSVKRKAEASRTPRAAKKKPPAKHSCATCDQCFSTSTDLMVHQATHSGHVCYVCTRKFNSFQQLSRHVCTRRTRRTAGTKSVQTRPPPRPPQLVQSGRKNVKTQNKQNDKKETKNKAGIPEIENTVPKEIQDLGKDWPSSAEDTDTVTDQSENESDSKPQIRLVQEKRPNDMKSISTKTKKSSTLTETVGKKDDITDLSNDVTNLKNGSQTSKLEAIQIGIKTESSNDIEDSVEEFKPIILTNTESKELIKTEPQIPISVIDKLDNYDIVEGIQETKEVLHEESEDTPLEAESEEVDVELPEAIESKTNQKANTENVFNETKAVVSQSANKSHLSPDKTPEYNTYDSLENTNMDELLPEVLSDNVDENNVYSDSIPSLSNKTCSAETSTNISEDNIEQLRTVNNSANKEAELNITHKTKLDVDANENEDNSNVPQVKNQTLDTVSEMEVHLAINPLSKDTVMFDTEMDIVDMQSEKTEDCVNQN